MSRHESMERMARVTAERDRAIEGRTKWFMQACGQALALTKMEAERDEARRDAEALAEALRNYEAWEAALILDAECWTDGLPSMTQAIYDHFIEVQTKRNAVLAAHDARKGA